MDQSSEKRALESQPQTEPDRRSFLQRATRLAGVAGAALAAPLMLPARAADDAGSAATKPHHANPVALTVALTAATPANLIVETTSGPVRGFISTGINTFKGIPYGAASQRFMPAQRPLPWTGVRSCLSYGPTCPQPLPNSSAPPNDLASFYAQGEPGRPAEDCLRINVWTPGLNQSSPLSKTSQASQRPVMLWIHGGGFESGSSHESVAYHGESLSRRGDVVFVSLSTWLPAGRSSPAPPTSVCWISSWRWNGCATTSRALAVTRTTSPSSANRAAVEKYLRCWRCQQPKACSTKRSFTAARS